MCARNSSPKAFRRAKTEFGRIPPSGKIASFTESKEGFSGLIDVGRAGELIFGKILSSGKPSIGDKVRPVLRIVSKSPPIEYGFSWEIE